VIHPARSDRAGFTLAEVMVTLLIMSGILFAIAKILTIARSSRDSIHNTREEQLAGPAILDLLEQDLRSLFVFNRRQRELVRIRNQSTYGFETDSIDFVTGTNSMIRMEDDEEGLRADFNEVGYHLRPSVDPDNEDRFELWRREDFGFDDEPFEGGEYTFLHDRVVAFDIRVFDEDGPDAEEVDSWCTESDEFRGLPARIEIDLTLAPRPRIAREQLTAFASEVTHRRIVRFPESLRSAVDVQAIAMVPSIQPPSPNAVVGPGGDPTQMPVGPDGQPLPGGNQGLDGNPFGAQGEGQTQTTGFGDNPFEGLGGGDG